MNIIQQDYFKKYKYVLDGGLKNDFEISPPKGFDSDNKTFKRSSSDGAHGVFSSFSNSLEFYRGDEKNDGGFSFLKESYDIYGINAKVTLTRYEDVGGVWELDYIGNLDYSTYIRSEFYIEIMFNESGLHQKIKARRTEKFEFGREETMDGSILPSLSDITSVAALDGRTILLINRLAKTTSYGDVEYPSGDWNKVITTPDYTEIVVEHDEIGTWGYVVIPVTMIAEQSGHVETVREYNILGFAGSYNLIQNTTAMMFYSDSSDEGPITIDFDIDLEFRDHGDWGALPDTLYVDLIKSTRQDDTTFHIEEVTTLLTVSNPSMGSKWSVQEQFKDTTELGTSYCLAIRSNKSNTGGQQNMFVTFTKTDIQVTDPSFYEKSETNILLPFEAMERTLKIITDEDDILESTILGRTDLGHDKDGFASLMGFTNGFWVRKFDDKPIKTSFRDFQESLHVIAQTGYGIERDGFKEKVVFEHVSHFYQDVVTMPINERPNNIIRTVAKEYFWSSLEIGYKYPTGDNLYEEQQGLDEPNIRNKFTSIIDRVEQSAEFVSQFSTDGYGKEFARRLPITTNPERDTRYDQRIMLMDLKRGSGSVFLERKWADDFEVPSPFNQQTTGIYSPETAVNLRLSPMNTLLRFGFWIGVGLQKYPDDYVRFSESNGNSSLKTKLREDIYGESKEYVENGKVLNSDLGFSLFNPEIITFEYPIDREMMQTIQGTVIVNGKKIMNYYGLVSFINEDRKIEYGFLLSAEPNGDGKWELLASTREPISIADKGIEIELPKSYDGFDYDINSEIN